MKLWVDDIRPAPNGWTRAETISQAINIINRYGMGTGFNNENRITHVSLDHDISIPVKVGGKWYNRPSPDTFKVVAYYMVELMTNPTGGLYEDIVLTTHSSNPEGRKDIVQIFEDSGFDCTEKPAEFLLRDNSNRI